MLRCHGLASQGAHAACAPRARCPRSLSRLDDHLPTLLGGPTKLYTTRCVMSELKQLGADTAKTAQAARSYALHKCGHDGKPLPAADCLLQQLGSGNGEHWWIASQVGGGWQLAAGSSCPVCMGRGCRPAAAACWPSLHPGLPGPWRPPAPARPQDRALQGQLAAIPGAPHIFASVNGLHLADPPERARARAAKQEAASLAVPQHELATAALRDLPQLQPRDDSLKKFR